MIFDNILKAVRYVFGGVSIKVLFAILIVSAAIAAVSSWTYSSKQNYIAILKQLEKLEYDKGDFKRTDIEGLYDICRDYRYLFSKKLTRSSSDKYMLDKGCDLISNIYAELPSKGMSTK